MTLAILFVLGVAFLATLAFAAAWLCFAIRNETSMMFSLGNFEDMHADSPGRNRSASRTAARRTPWPS